MVESIDGRSPGRQMYRGRGQLGPASYTVTGKNLVAPEHPNRSGGLVLRAGLNTERTATVYYQADGHSQSESDPWKHYRDATQHERRLIHSLLAEGRLVQVETSFGILLYRKAEKESRE